MSFASACRVAPFVASLACVTTCRDIPVSPNAPAAREQHGAVAPANYFARTPGLRRQFHDLALRAPGFAGIYVDEHGSAVISVATDAFSETAKNEVVRWLADGGRSDLLKQPPTLRRVNYNYAALVEHLDAIQRVVAAVVGVNSFGIDVVKGQVIVGVVDTNIARRVRETLALTGLPADAIQVEAHGEIRPDGLQDRVRPLIGGIQLGTFDGYACSVGYVGWRKLDPASGSQIDTTYRVFTTSAHCTDNREAVTGTILGQPAYYSNPVGVEVDEAPVYTGGYDCTNYPRCQSADVAVLRLDDSVASHGLTTAWSNSVSPPTNPPYLGNQAYGGSGMVGALQGDWVHKVGRSTGQTSAYVTQGCVDINYQSNPSLWYPCQQQAKYGARGGDSGGTVFMAVGAPSYSTRIPAGMHSSSITGTQYGYFAPHNAIEYATGWKYVYTW